MQKKTASLWAASDNQYAELRQLFHVDLVLSVSPHLEEDSIIKELIYRDDKLQFVEHKKTPKR